MFKQWKQDIDAILSRDPAARSKWEIVLCYPSFRAVRRHRRAHWLWLHDHKLLARWLSQRTRKLTGIEIHPGATIGKGLFIDHGMGVVIGETAEIGDNVTLYQDVTLGGTGKDIGKRHPTIGDGVVIGAGAKVLGPFTVGAGAKIGASAVVLKAVPEGATVVGNPGRVVRHRGERPAIDLDQINLPDPVKERIERMSASISRLEECVLRMQRGESCEVCSDAGGEHCLKVKREDTTNEDL